MTPNKVAPEKVSHAGEFALGGESGANAKQLLQAAQDAGTDFLHGLTKTALGRLGTNAKALAAPSLFTQAELGDLADSIAESLAMGELLGRVRVRMRAEAIAPDVATFAEEPSAPGAEASEPFAFNVAIEPLPPQAALDFFASLVPALAVNPDLFAGVVRRQAFTLAASTEQALTARVKQIILDNLQSGQGSRAGAIEIEETLAAAGVTPANPQYAEMVYRTNALGAYNRGAQEELQADGVREIFPVWEYIGIHDGRERDRHRVHFGKFYPTGVTFEEVRDSEKGEFDGYNCRCTMRPVSRWEWAKLQLRGAVIDPAWQLVGAMAA